MEDIKTYIEKLSYPDFNTPRKTNQLIKRLEKYKNGNNEVCELINNQIEHIQLFRKYCGNKDFFPTPNYIINHILNYIPELNPNYEILEPSAGLGDIAYVIQNYLDTNFNWCDNKDKPKLFVCENNTEFIKYLDKKRYKVLSDDFFKINKKFDLIIMNPPFSNIYDHIEHASKLLKNNGELNCIVPQNEKANFIIKTKNELGSEYYKTGYNFKGYGTNIKADLLVIDRKKQTELNFLLNDLLNHENILLNFYYLYLGGNYTNYDDYINIKNKLTKKLDTDYIIQLFIKTLSLEFNFSEKFIATKIKPQITEKLIPITKQFLLDN